MRNQSVNLEKQLEGGCFPTQTSSWVLSLRGAHKESWRCSAPEDHPQPPLSILRPIFAPPAAPPPPGGYHHNTDCSLELEQRGRGRPLPSSRALPPRHSSSLALSVSHRGEGKVGRNPKKKSPTKSVSPSAEDSESGPAEFGLFCSKNRLVNIRTGRFV